MVTEMKMSFSAMTDLLEAWESVPAEKSAFENAVHLAKGREKWEKPHPTLIIMFTFFFNLEMLRQKKNMQTDKRNH